MESYFMQLALGLVPIWAATEGIGRIIPLKNELIALILGFGFALVAHGSGLIVAPGMVPWDWGMAMLGGIVVSLGAGVFHDKVAKPLTPEKP